MPAHVISVSPCWVDGPNMNLTGMRAFKYVPCHITRNFKTFPFLYVTCTTSPARSECSCQNTAGQQVESRWPKIVALPRSPGRGPRSYQATSPHLYGACTSEVVLNLSASTAARTPKR